MPGLVGIISRTANPAFRSDLDAMLRCVRHREFYAQGTYVNEGLGLYLGWTSHQRSYCDCMPVSDAAGDVMVVFYGEHFDDAHPEPREDSARHHAKLQATELVDLYTGHEADFLKRLNGWFHGVLIDLKKRQATLFTDRYGMQRLYYHEDGDSFLFASEAKALLQIRPSLRSLDERSVAEYFTCDCVLGDKTLFSGISTVPGAAAWTFEQGGSRSRGSYFSVSDWEAQPELEAEEFEENFGDLFDRIAKRYLRSSLPLGISLTGGLDTRMVMAHLGDAAGAPACYTFGSMYRDSFDVLVARQVARACGLQHETLRLGQEFLKLFPDLARETVYLSDGYLGACGSYELYLNQLARDVAPVRLTGNYGGQLMRGARGFDPGLPAMQLLQSDFRPHVYTALGRFRHEEDCHPLTFRIFKMAPWHGYGRLAVEQSQVVERTPFMDNDLVQLMYRCPPAARRGSGLSYKVITRGNAALAAIPTDRRISRVNGRVRKPAGYYLETALVKADYLYKSGMPHWAERLHQLLGPFRPDTLIMGRHRFTYFRSWLRHELKEYVLDTLLGPQSHDSPYVKHDVLEQVVQRHLRGTHNYTHEIDKLLTLRLVHDALLVGH